MVKVKDTEQDGVGWRRPALSQIRIGGLPLPARAMLPEALTATSFRGYSALAVPTQV